jgi:S-formylglutathione hydrolase FrmB
MAFATIHYFSRSLRKASSLNLVFPEDPTVPRPWAVFYLLHGLSDDQSIWVRRTSIERYVEGWPLVVVMPDGGRG